MRNILRSSDRVCEGCGLSGFNGTQCEFYVKVDSLVITSAVHAPSHIGPVREWEIGGVWYNIRTKNYYRQGRLK